MQTPSPDYLLPPALASGLADALAEAGWPCRIELVTPVTVRLLDSFDWGAYGAGALIEERCEADACRLLWHDLKASAEPREQVIAASLGLALDLPAGPLRDLILPALGPRRLLPIVVFDIEPRVLRLLDEEDKTVVRLMLETYRLQTPGRGLAPRLRLLPLKGYESQARDVAAWLTEVLGLEPAERPLLVDALDQGERVPGDYSSKLDYRLDPAQRADSAAREIFLGLLDTLEANIPGTKANLDSEFLHDLRVATRRIRAALSQIPGVLPPPIVDQFKERFGWLQQITGPVRDLDVYLLDFDTYQAILPAPLRPDLEPLRGYVLAHYAEAQGQLVRDLDSPAMETLLRDWRRALTEPLAAGDEPTNAARPVKALADQRIWRMVRRVRKEGRAIDADSPAEDMHELRKSCKKLRYLMEFFQSLYPGSGVGKAVKVLRRLLDNLGDFQDLAIQADHLRDLAERMRAEGQGAGHLSTGTLLAMGALVADLLRRQESARADFAETFAGFDSAEGRALFRGLFHAGPNADQAESA